MIKTLRIAIITILLFLMAYAGYSVSLIPSVKETFALATTIKPEKFTELYLENHTKLPKSNQVKNPEWFEFTVHNLEHQTMNYPYEVYIEDMDGNRAEIIKDIFRLEHDQYKTVPVYFELLEEVERAKIVVRLINKDQTIHFWIGKSNEEILLQREQQAKSGSESAEITAPKTERSTTEL